MALPSPGLKILDPHGKLDYAVDWEDWLTDAPTPGDSLSAITWALVGLATDASAADLIISGMTLQVLDYAQLATDNAEVTVTIDGVTTVLVEGTDWTADTSDEATATSLAAAIDALDGVGATAATDTVTVTRDGIAIISQGIIGDKAVVWLNALYGVVVGDEYQLTNHIVTADGREDDCSFNIRIENQ
jgi:hypothetical protein